MLSITLHPSYLLALFLVAMHALALASVWLVPLVLAAKIGTAVVLASSLVLSLRQHVWRAGKRSVRAVRLTGECDMSLQGQDATWLEAAILPSSFISPYLTVLNLNIEGERRARHVVILPDAMDAEQFRQLRVWLRWKCKSQNSDLPQSAQR
jgi:toxin CptA